MISYSHLLRQILHGYSLLLTDLLYSKHNIIQIIV
nr:MAG TPA: hypothetical protein [Caudoviricetes sp.]DAL46706.1 MAG TPA_asm: hypothetical protein [Bacteriophage sp.]